MKQFFKSPRPFWLNALLLIVSTSLVGQIISLASGTDALSNVYFFASVLFLLIAALPVFTEMGGNAKTSRQARKEGKHPLEIIKEQEKAGRYSRGTRITYLFGLCGFLCFILAILTI